MSAETANPKALVVGAQGLANKIAEYCPHWTVFPAAATVNDLWDNIESRQFPYDPAVVIFTDGSGTDDEELEASMVEFARYSRVLIVARPERGTKLAQEAARYAAREGATNITEADFPVMPMTSLEAAMSVLHAHTSELGAPPAIPEPAAPPVSPEPAPAPAAPPAPAASQVPPVAPAPEPVAPPVAPAPAPANSGLVIPPAPSLVVPTAPLAPANDHAPAYAAAVVEHATRDYHKRPDAIPNQMTIAVMSAKGGAGKSTSAISLAGMVAASSAAAGDPKRVVLVDLDTRDGQVGSLIGQYVPTAVNIRVLPRWDAAAVKSQLVHDQKLGIDALLAPLRPRNADDVGPEFYSQIIQVLQTTHDVVILDCSVNYLDPLLGMGFALADEILFVTTLAATSVQGMARALTELFADPTEGGLGIPREKVGVVANMVINNVGMKRDTILKAALGAPLVGQIPAAQDDVLLATNHTRMADLLKNPRLGPAYFKLAQTCLPGWALAPIATGSVAAPGAPGAPDGGEKKKGGLFRR